jgi:Type II CAAX prenyl endopeptidase Rce1-like
VGVSLAARHWLVVGVAVWPASDRPVARLDLRRLAANSRSRIGVDQQLGLIVLAVVLINLWEETVWAGFFQTRLEARFNFVVAAVLTALPFAGVHVPLLLLDDQVSAVSVLMGIAGLLILGIVVRLLMGVMLRAASDSVLAVGILHQIFDASNNDGALVDSLLDGADARRLLPASRGWSLTAIRYVPEKAVKKPTKPSRGHYGVRCGGGHHQCGPPTQRRSTAAFSLLTLILLYALVANVLEAPDGLAISMIFIAGILAVSLASRLTRALELRVDDVQLDALAQLFIRDCARRTIRLVATSQTTATPLNTTINAAKFKAITISPRTRTSSSSRSPWLTLRSSLPNLTYTVSSCTRSTEC